MIRQGDLYWLDVGRPVGSGPGYRHPYVVIQNDTVNETTIRSVLMCTLTSNLRRAGAWGNVLLQRGEAGLPEQSVVLVSQIVTVDKTRLRERVGRLSAARIRQILDGIRLITEPGPD